MTMALEARPSVTEEQPHRHWSTSRQSGSTPSIGPTTNNQAQSIVNAITKVLRGRRDIVELVVTALLAEGHVLIEDIPGVGKTTLAKALAQTIQASVGRIQFTPDVMPSDIIGVSVYRSENANFEFIPGPIFNHLVIADEINRASAKTQSALLEAMQEKQVTADGKSRPLPHPFIVIATQNPIEMEGTYHLPESQRDRFMMSLSIGYPDHRHEVEMLDSQEQADPLTTIRPVITASEVAGLIEQVRHVHAASAVKDYIVDLAEATRRRPDIRVGASPRASIQLLRAAKAAAVIAGRSHVLPDDIQHVLPHVWGHRLLMTKDRSGRSSSRAIQEIMRTVAVR
jgi:MoxR-like ATPase